MTQRKKNKIIVSIDFQDESMAALKQSYQVAKFLKAEIVLVHVFELPDFLQSLFTKNEEIVRITAETLTKLNDLVVKARTESGLEVSSRLETGKAYIKIVEVANEINARMIIMGRSGTIAKKRLGSNTFHIVAKAPCPVITVKHYNEKFTFKNIVMPLDLTKKTAEQTAMAIALGRYFNSTIHMVSVLSGNVFLQRSRIYSKMVKVDKEITKQGVATTSKILPKSSVPEFTQIMNYATDLNADLIMMLVRQDETVSQYYIGKVAQHIINESKIPVLSMIPASQQSKEDSPIDTVWDPLNLF